MTRPGVFGLVFFAGTMIGLLGCPAAVPVVGPATSCVSTVIADALKGDSIAQILADAGPSCVATVEEVVTILLGSTNPAVQSTAAFKEALSARHK